MPTRTRPTAWKRSPGRPDPGRPGPFSARSVDNASPLPGVVPLNDGRGEGAHPAPHAPRVPARRARSSERTSPRRRPDRLRPWPALSPQKVECARYRSGTASKPRPAAPCRPGWSRRVTGGVGESDLNLCEQMFDPGGVPVIESVFESTVERQPPLRPVASPAAPGRGLLPVVPALRGVLPEGGLRRGTAVSVAGGDAGLLLALAAGVRETDGGWAAAVGLPDLGRTGWTCGGCWWPTIPARTGPRWCRCWPAPSN